MAYFTLLTLPIMYIPLHIDRCNIMRRSRKRNAEWQEFWHNNKSAFLKIVTALICYSSSSLFSIIIHHVVSCDTRVLAPIVM